MKEIKLSNGWLTQVDDSAFEALNQHRWRCNTPTTGETFYAFAYINGRRLLMHRLLLQPEAHEMVDHADGNGLNNQQSNLRICTRSQNAANSGSRPGSSRYKGISWDKKALSWAAHIRGYGKQVSLGWFDTEVEGARAYDAAALFYFGEFARLNFPELKEELRSAYNPKQARKQKRGTTRFRGVGVTSSQLCPWRAHVCVGGKRRHIGVFKTEEEAARAYDSDNARNVRQCSQA